MIADKRLPSMEDAGELAGIDVLHPGGFDLSKRIGQIVRMEGKHVLEVGCGRGAFSSYFAKHFGARITGVDMSPDMIASSSRRARMDGVVTLTEFRVANAEQLPFGDGSFDVVVSECGPVGLVPEPQKAVSEMARVTKPGGYLALHSPVWLAEVPADMRADIERRLGGRTFTLSEWHDMLEKAGLFEKWVEDWSGPEQIGKIRPGRNIRRLSDVFTLAEKALVFLRVSKRFGCTGLLHLRESFRKVTPMFYDGTIGTYLLRYRKPEAGSALS